MIYFVSPGDLVTTNSIESSEYGLFSTVNPDDDDKEAVTTMGCDDVGLVVSVATLNRGRLIDSQRACVFCRGKLGWTWSHFLTRIR